MRTGRFSERPWRDLLWPVRAQGKPGIETLEQVRVYWEGVREAREGIREAWAKGTPGRV